MLISNFYFFFFFNDTATTEIYTLSLHDALPISWILPQILIDVGMGIQESIKVHELCMPDVSRRVVKFFCPAHKVSRSYFNLLDRKSTRLNSSHGYISYAVFCLKKKRNEYLTGNV